MNTWPLLSIVHLVGLVLAAGAATVKLTLLVRSNADRALVPAYLAVARPTTRLIIVGMILLTLSGVAWVVLFGFPLTLLLIAKLVLVAAIWVLGPVIDNLIEPRFRALAAEPATPAFQGARMQYLAWEFVATSLFYVIIVMWALRG